MNIRRAGCLAIILLFCLLRSAVAQEVTLSAKRGGLTVSGTLLGYDGAFFRVDTEFGEVTLDRADVICAGTGCPDPDAFVAETTFSGAERVGRILMPPLIETFARRNGYEIRREELDERSFRYTLRTDGVALARFTFRLGTSAEGFADIIADEADLAMSLREVSRAEALLAREAGRGQLRDAGRSRVLALDALVPIVSVANAVETVSFGDLRRLALGNIRSWTDLDGAGREGAITLHLPARETSLGQALRLRVLGGAEITAPNVVVHASTEALMRAVVEDPHAIGLTAFSGAGDARIVPVAGPCGAISEPTVAAIKAEDYPLTTPVFLYAPARRLPEPVRAFIAYATSPAAQRVVRRSGFLDESPETVPLAAQGDRLVAGILGSGDETALSDLREMAGALAGKARLSVTFRFEGGSADLDAHSRSNVKLLTQTIRRGAFDGRALSFVGFSDARGAASANRRLSRQRAEAVRRAILHSLGERPDQVAFATEAFGEALPMACEEVGWGRHVNRRVEVWLD